jgi:predicted site-specific integrase-resolvase
MCLKSNVEELFGRVSEQPEKAQVCDIRVSSQQQHEDFNLQIEECQPEYSTYEIIQDIGSGINWERKSFKTLLD